MLGGAINSMYRVGHYAKFTLCSFLISFTYLIFFTQMYKFTTF